MPSGDATAVDAGSGGGDGAFVLATLLATTGGGGIGSALDPPAADDAFACDSFADVGLATFSRCDDGSALALARPAGACPLDLLVTGAVDVAGGVAIATAANVAALAASAAWAFGVTQPALEESSPLFAGGKRPGILPAANHR
jgi:hypothetical protein